FLAATDFGPKQSRAFQPPQFLRQVGRISAQSLRQIPQVMTSSRVREVIGQQPATRTRTQIEHVVLSYHICGNSGPLKEMRVQDSYRPEGLCGICVSVAEAVGAVVSVAILPTALGGRALIS